MSKLFLMIKKDLMCDNCSRYNIPFKDKYWRIVVKCRFCGKKKVIFNTVVNLLDREVQKYIMRKYKEKKLYTLKEAADIIGVSEAKLKYHINVGHVIHIKIGSKTLLTDDQVEWSKIFFKIIDNIDIKNQNNVITVIENEKKLEKIKEELC